MYKISPMENKALLFDFDGVVVDTENYYTILWDGIGEKYLGVKDFCRGVKGTTLVSILNKFFSDKRELWDVIEAEVNEFEANMPVDYIPGVVDFVRQTRIMGYKSAIVTSSNKTKMSVVYAKRPEILDLFDTVLTSEDFSASKPDPDCFLRGMEILGAEKANTVVFEDSLYGLQAAKASGACVVGLTTTNTTELVSRYSDIHVADFTDTERLFDFIGHKF